MVQVDVCEPCKEPEEKVRVPFHVFYVEGGDYIDVSLSI